jgi:hypothetical protein
MGIIASLDMFTGKSQDAVRLFPVTTGKAARTNGTVVYRKRRA